MIKPSCQRIPLTQEARARSEQCLSPAHTNSSIVENNFALIANRLVILSSDYSITVIILSYIRINYSLGFSR